MAETVTRRSFAGRVGVALVAFVPAARVLFSPDAALAVPVCSEADLVCFPQYVYFAYGVWWAVEDCYSRSTCEYCGTYAHPLG